MYHISDIKKFIRCEKLYFYSKNENNANFQPYLRADDSIYDLLVSYFDIENCFFGVKNDKTERFFNECNNYEWFSRARFADNELRINIPFMHKVNDGYDLYFIYYGTVIKDLDLIAYRISKKILNKLNIVVHDINVIYLNENYINDGVLNPKELFLCTDTFKENKILDLVNEYDFDYESIILQMEKNEENNIPKKNKFCRQNGLCDYYYKCFPNENILEDDSILTLVSSANKNKMYDEGIRQLKDVNIDLLEGNRVQYAQIMASKNNGLFIDKYALKDYLNKLNDRPISFIDFEWDRYLIPTYRKMAPMSVLCFEYALYYIDESGHMEHKTFVGTKDCRLEFIKSLLENVPSKGPILAYNAEGAEQLRLKELGEMFPEYKDALDSLISRFVDLAIPFTEGMIYDIRMKGNYTLKKLVDICSDYSYSKLDIYDGMAAVFNWRDVDKGKCDEKQIVEELKEYCSLDAYGLFLVYKWMIELIIESN